MATIARTPTVALRREALSIAALPLIVLGGWFIGLEGKAVIAPGIIALGFLLSRFTPRVQGMVYAGQGITALLLLGSALQALRGEGTAYSAFGFALCFSLSVMVGALSTATLRRGLTALYGVAAVCTGWAWWQMFEGVRRVYGPLNMNPNLLAGFLAFCGLMWLATDKHQTRGALVSGLLATGILFTGSRWGLAVFLTGLCFLALIRRIGWLHVSMVGLVLAVVVAVAPHDTAGAFRFDGSLSAYLDRAGNDIAFRQDLAFPPGILPHGFVGTRDNGAHNLWTRSAVEAGLPGALILAAVCLVAFVRGSNLTRWALAILLALGVMDYYVWGPFQASPLLWAFIGLGWRRE